MLLLEVLAVVGEELDLSAPDGHAVSHRDSRSVVAIVNTPLMEK